MSEPHDKPVDVTRCDRCTRPATQQVKARQGVSGVFCGHHAAKSGLPCVQLTSLYIQGMRERAAAAAPKESTEETPSPPCIDCGEEPGSCPEGRCRDCDLSFVSSGCTCRECLAPIWRADMFGPLESQHVPTCSLKASKDYGPRNDDEQWAIREAKNGERCPAPKEST